MILRNNRFLLETRQLSDIPEKSETSRLVFHYFSNLLSTSVGLVSDQISDNLDNIALYIGSGYLRSIFEKCNIFPEKVVF